MVSGIFLLTCVLLVGPAFALRSLSQNEQVKKELHDMKETSSGQNTTATYIGNTIITTTSATAAAAASPPPPSTTNKNKNCDADRPQGAGFLSCSAHFTLSLRLVSVYRSFQYSKNSFHDTSVFSSLLTTYFYLTGHSPVSIYNTALLYIVLALCAHLVWLLLGS